MPTLRLASSLLCLALLSACVTVTGARRYEAVSDTTWRPGEDGALYDAVGQEVRRAGLQFVADPALAEACRQIAEVMAHAPGHRLPSSATRDLLLRRAGVLEHEYTFSLWEGPPVAVPDDLRDTVRRQLSRTHDVELVAGGAARTTADDGTGLLVLMTAYRRVLFQSPPPRVAEPGDVVRLRFRTRPSLRDLKLYVTPPSGAVRDEAITDAAQITLDRKGIWQIEIGSDGRWGPFELVNFPIYVGVSDDVPIRISEEVPSDAGQVEAEVLRLVNEARKAHDLPPVEVMPELVGIARAHSGDMRDGNFFGHTSPTTGTPDDRVARGGLRTAAVAENVAQNLTAQDVHDGLMRSPGHRMNVLEPAMTHVGIGAASSPRGAPPESWFVTELFVRVNPRVDIPRARRQVLDLANEIRREHRLPALESHPRLGAIAQAAAEDFLRQKSTLEQALNRALAEVQAQGIPLRALSAQAMRTSDLAHVKEMELLGNAKFDHLGIGVAQGTLGDGVPNELFVVVIAANTVAPLLSHGTAVQGALSAVNRARAAKRLPPLVIDPVLQQRADGLAERFFDGVATEVLFADVRRSPPDVPYKTLRYQAAQVLAPEDVAQWDVPVDPSIRRVGLGFAQGNRDGDIENGMYVFLIAVDAP